MEEDCLPQAEVITILITLIISTTIMQEITIITTIIPHLVSMQASLTKQPQEIMESQETRLPTTIPDSLLKSNLR